MSEFKININEISKIVPEQKDVVKELKQEIKRINRIASSSALSSGAFHTIIASLKKVSGQLEDNTEAANKLNDCLSETISLYKKAEEIICGEDGVKKKIRDLIDDVSDFTDDLKEILLKIGMTPIEIAMLLNELQEFPMDALLEALSGKDVNWEEWIKNMSQRMYLTRLF